MFVYNNCTTDARVLKEAATLRDAGYEVQIVAVLDRLTEPFEMRDGIRIVRIDRQPPHYKLLRTSRRVRRFLRLSKARMRRDIQQRRRRAGRSFQRAGRRVRLPRLGTPPRVLLVVFAVPIRAYRYARWRVLLHVPAARRRYYRRRVRANRSLATDSYRSQMEAFRARNVGVSAAPAAKPAPRPVVQSPSARTPGPVARWAKRVEQWISHRCWKAVMVFHKPLMFTAYYRAAYRLVRDQEFDLLHAHDLLTLPVGVAVSRSTKKPLVYDSHELYTEMSTLRRVERLVWSFLEHRLIHRATTMITVCDSIASEFERRYKVPAPLTLLNCPLRPVPAASEKNLLRAKVGLEHSTKRIVLYQGGLVPNRGLEELIEASRSFDDAVLVLMGWGRIEDALRAQLERDGLQDSVLITPPVPQDELIGYTAGADVGVIPFKAVGLNNYYATPNKLFEYLAAGLPIACSGFPELTRFVEGASAGATFDPDDPADMAQTINALLADEEALDAMRHNARRAGETFVWENESLKLVELYEDLSKQLDVAAAPALAVSA